jgi:hypothetical protein
MNTNRIAEIAKAREVDTEVARLWNEAHLVGDEIARIGNWIADVEKYAAKSYNQNERYQTEAAAKIAKYEAKLEELRPVYAQKRQAAVDFDKENYEGWNRFFLVKHIHNSQHCSSFRPTTRVGWLPNVSGLTEAEAVAEHGATLCTICFPSAPVELTVAAPKPGECAGSGKPYSKEYSTGRERAHYGRAGYCPVCLRWQTVTASGVMRKHKADDETRRHALDKR